jgi:hypothetical protein
MGQGTQNASLCEESRRLTVERNAMAARIAVSRESRLSKYKTANIAATKAADDARAELMQAKEFHCPHVEEAETVRWSEMPSICVYLKSCYCLPPFKLQERVVALEQRIEMLSKNPLTVRSQELCRPLWGPLNYIVLTGP